MYIFPVSMHEYIKHIFLTCTREVGDPVLSQNINLKYVVPKAKQGKTICKQTPECSPWTHPWAEFGSPVNAQSHQDILKSAKHHKRSYYSNSGLRIYKPGACVFLNRDCVGIVLVKHC